MNLATSSMTLWIRIYINAVIISWYLCTVSLIMISSLNFQVILKFFISFIKEYRRLTFRLPCDVTNDVIITKNTFFGIIRDDLFIFEVKLKLCLIFQNFQNGRHFELEIKFFSSDMKPEVEYTSKVVMSISDICALDRRSSSNIDGDISISKFDILCDLVMSSMTSWNIICTTRHPQQCTCKILFLWN